jgi:hypothetical protein
MGTEAADSSIADREFAPGWHASPVYPWLLVRMIDTARRGSRVCPRRWQLCAASIVAVALLLGLSGTALGSETFGSSTTNAGDNLRTGWYPHEPSINPRAVDEHNFGRLWSKQVEGPVYAQPLLADETVFVATEDNWLYGLNPDNGKERWSDDLGSAWNPEEIGPCYNITPTIGVTATPVIDPETGIAYFTYESYDSPTHEEATARWYMGAVDVATGKKVEGFPVELSGTAENAPGAHFSAPYQLQRPGLLLLNGAVYAAFGSQCDFGSWNGWVFGVSTAPGKAASERVTARWVAEETGEGAGIWQSGAGLSSDGPDSILLCTGNGNVPETPTPGHDPSGNLGEATVRLDVGPSGSLRATDFFAPSEARSDSERDEDWASSGVTGLPPEYFGAGTSTPHLAISIGKDAYIYLLNLENLGGFDQEPLEGGIPDEDALQRLPGSEGFTGSFPYGGVWSRPGVWPGEGGWIYVPTASEGPALNGSSSEGRLLALKYSSAEGEPRLVPAASSTEKFGFGSSAPVITSNGTRTGSAIVWTEWAPVESHGTGEGAELRAYETIPQEGKPHLLWHEPIGYSSKFATPGVGEQRLYVGTQDGHVIAFGPHLAGSEPSFQVTTDGQSSQQTLELTAEKELEIAALESSSPEFVLGQPAPPLPITLQPGQTVEVPVTFEPSGTGAREGHVLASVNAGEGEQNLAFSLQGTAEAPFVAKESPLGVPQEAIVTLPGPSTKASEPLPFSPAQPKQQAPDARITATELSANASGTFALKVNCPSGRGACTGTVTLSKRVVTSADAHHRKLPKVRTIVLARGSFHIEEGRVGAVKLRLSAYARSLVKRTHLLHATVTVLALNPAGLRHTTHQAIAIRYQSVRRR